MNIGQPERARALPLAGAGLELRLDAAPQQPAPPVRVSRPTVYAVDEHGRPRVVRR